MATSAAVDLPFSKTQTFASFKEVCRYANWPEDFQFRSCFTLYSPNALDMDVDVSQMSLHIIESTAAQFPEFKRRLQELEILIGSANLKNFKIHLALRSNFEDWASCRVFSADAVENILIPEVKLTIHQAKECTKKDFHSSIPEFLQEARNAFKAPERAHHGRQLGSAKLCQTLVNYHRQFSLEKDAYLSPHTSIVAPPGIGKTYTVSQLAVQHGKYVIYLNFAPKTSNGFPGRSPYASLILSAFDTVNHLETFLERREGMESLWSLIVEALLHLARLARTFGIGPEEFFDYQTGEDYAKQQDLIKNSLEFAIRNPPFSHKSDQEVNWVPFDNYCKSIFTSAGYKTKDDGENNAAAPDSSMPSLQFVLCIDEAWDLLTVATDPQKPKPLFRALQTALWSSATGGEDTFFGVFLNTAPVISKTSTAVAHEPSQKIPINEHPNAVSFPPVYEIFTRGIFASPTPAQLTSPNTHWRDVATLGLPIWGALLQQGSTLKNVFQLSQEKYGPERTGPQSDDQTVALLTLLSYRIPFIVCDPCLVKKFVSGWMQNLAYTSGDREDLIVLQPTDPMLALVAREHGVTMKPYFEQTLQVFINELSRGRINVREASELVAGIVLLLGFDSTSQGRYLKPIPLQDFLASLFRKHLVLDLLSHSFEYEQHELRDMLLNGQVFFNRIQNRVTTPKMVDLYNMYRSCTACYLPTSFKKANILIPVWVPETRWRKSRFGCILVLMRNQEGHSATPMMQDYAYRHTSDAFDKLGFDDDVPIIGLMMCLQGQVCSTGVREPSKNSRKNIGVMLCVGLDRKEHPMFDGPYDDPLKELKKSVLSWLGTLKFDVNTHEPEEDMEGNELVKFETEFYP
ncbi:hypothetical protein HOO65_080158 [Ceratocystis lukuohia]|uniref:AAA+ ATPase domain-containing protein n=1 Tax=Ceratocystis lukuohia TaxID=2019550 RepID=A0ABR4MAB5_9PEZI